MDKPDRPLNYATPTPPDRARLNRFLRREALSAIQVLLVASFTLTAAGLTAWPWWPHLVGVLVGLLLASEAVKRLLFGNQ